MGSFDLALTHQTGLALATCRAVVQAAEAMAVAKGCAVCIAIVDNGGHLQNFVRMDGSHGASIEVAIAKARCAAAFRRPTKVFADAVAAGSTALAALPGLVPFEGGIPLLHLSEVVGAILRSRRRIPDFCRTQGR